MNRHDCFCACECVNGYCPIAMDRENDWYSDMGYDVPKNCRSCQYNTGRCEDCIFEKSSECPLTNADSRDIIEPSN